MDREAIILFGCVRSSFWVVIWLCAVSGCATTRQVDDESGRRQMLALLMPGRIEIVRPFTRIESFDDDDVPDGIELLLSAVNALDNPGLMIAGTLRAELYEYVPASGERKGRRLDHWNIDLTTEHNQRRFWNRLTQMYEFRLGVDLPNIAVADQYVLAVTYTSPLGDHFADECVIRYGSGRVSAGRGRERSP